MHNVGSRTIEPCHVNTYKQLLVDFIVYILYIGYEHQVTSSHTPHNNAFGANRFRREEIELSVLPRMIYTTDRKVRLANSDVR